MRGALINPRFSPDGQWIAASSYGSFTAKTFLIPAAGGAPRSISENFYSAFFQAWSPDGKKILLSGSRDQGTDSNLWVIPLDGGPAIQTGFETPVVGANRNPTRVLEWLDDYILYTDGNLWKMKLPVSTGKVTAGPERLTVSSSIERVARAISMNSGKLGSWEIVFASEQDSTNLWSVAIDPNGSKLLGEPRKLVADAVDRESPSLSADGGKLLYVAHKLDSLFSAYS